MVPKKLQFCKLPGSVAWGNSLFATDGQTAIHFQCATETTQHGQIMSVKIHPVGCFLAPEKQSSLPSVKIDSLCFILLAFMQCS